MLPDQKEITYSLSYKEILEILKIIDESPCQELRLELEGFKLEIRKEKERRSSQGGDSLGLAPAAPAPFAGGMKTPEGQAAKLDKKEEISKAEAAPAVTGEISKASGIEVKTPLTGTFYRAPAPGARPFVEVGEAVEAGEQVGIVEVMKLMNSIKTPVKGTVRQILVENETMVKMGQTLMIVEPS
jgi:acetyl-CoA carboxylase biotin carboxyl carrier protein